MPTHVAFLRAVNVGGRFVTMEALREAATEAGFSDVESHIQSGNLRVRTTLRSPARVAERLEAALGERAGFEVPVIVRSPARLAAFVDLVDAMPPLLGPDGHRYVAFADRPIPPEAADQLGDWSVDGERARVVDGDNVLAELTRDFHKTTLTNARIERITQCRSTWRDLSVVRAIVEKWST